MSTTSGQSLVARLTRTIDADHPIPMYLQIASTVRGEIASGQLPIGASLPSVRSLGGTLEISYHTVRHAWDLLVEEGVLSVRRGRGAVVVAGPSTGGPWHLMPSTPGRVAERPVAWLVGEPWSHAADIAGIVMVGHAVVAAPWPLDAGMPPPGPILLLDGVSLPEGWAARQRDTHALPTTLPRDAVAAIRWAADLLDTRDVRLVGIQPTNAEASALLRQLPRVGLTVVPGHETEGAIPAQAVRLVLVTDSSAHDARSGPDPRMLVLQRTPAAGPLAGLARELRWAPM